MDASRQCQCNDCESHTLTDCINQKCECCDLEDSFAVLIKRENMDVLAA
jgi:hypothetical protein